MALSLQYTVSSKELPLIFPTAGPDMLTTSPAQEPILQRKKSSFTQCPKDAWPANPFADGSRLRDTAVLFVCIKTQRPLMSHCVQSVANAGAAAKIAASVNRARRAKQALRMATHRSCVSMMPAPSCNTHQGIGASR